MVLGPIQIHEWLLLFCGIVWSIWNDCNNLIFNEVVIYYDDIYHFFFPIELQHKQNVMMRASIIQG